MVNDCFWPSLTKCEFLSSVRGEGEAKKGHRGDEDAGHNQVEKVVQCPSPAKS